MHTVYDRKKVGRRLRNGLIANGLTMRELADEVGCSWFSIRDYCSGKTVMPLDKAAAICDVFGWSLDRLAVRDDRVKNGSRR